MNRKLKLSVVLLIVVLCLFVLPGPALALRGEELAAGPSVSPASPAVEPAGEESTPPEELPEESPQPEEEPSAPELGPLTNGREEKLFAPSGSVVYNDGGTVYNNGGTVYNNEGLVYNNEGAVYNNAGTVYANGGTVYNNGGTVYDNGAVIVENGASAPAQSALPESAAEPDGYHRVSFAEDYGALIETEGLEREGAGYLLKEGESCVLRPAAGVSVVSASADTGALTAQEDGSYLLETEEDVLVTFELQTDAPVLSLQPGTYSGTQYLELTGPEGAELFITDDGIDPIPGKNRYTGPVAIRKGAVIKASAQLKGALPSEIVLGEYAIVSIEGPSFEPEKAGYVSKPQSITVTNSGETDGKVAGVALSGENAESFHLSHSSGKTVPAGTSLADYWTVQPLETLQPGTYTALVTVTLDGGESVEKAFSFTVEAAG